MHYLFVAFRWFVCNRAERLGWQDMKINKEKHFRASLRTQQRVWASVNWLVNNPEGGGVGQVLFQLLSASHLRAKSLHSHQRRTVKRTYMHWRHGDNGFTMHPRPTVTCCRGGTWTNIRKSQYSGHLMWRMLVSNLWALFVSQTLHLNVYIQGLILLIGSIFLSLKCPSATHESKSSKSSQHSLLIQ